MYNLELDLRTLDERSQAYLRRVEAGLEARPDVKEVVDQIDERQEGTTGDLVAEIEQFLRSQSDDDQPERRPVRRRDGARENALRLPEDAT